MLQAQNELEAAIAGLRAGEAELESRRQAHYAASDAVHSAQGQLYEANAQVSRLEAEIRHVVDSRNRLQRAASNCSSRSPSGTPSASTAPNRSPRPRMTWPPALPAPKRRAPPPRTPRRRCPTSSSACAKPPAAETMRAALARVEQNLALVAQSQRDADRQMQALEQRRERFAAGIARAA